MKKIYVAQRPGDDELGDCRVTVVSAGGAKPLRHVVYHSPTGLEWSYAGSGPADLALSILADYFGEQPTVEQLRRGQAKCWPLHQAFKWAFIASADRRGFSITTQEITRWLEQQGHAPQLVPERG